MEQLKIGEKEIKEGAPFAALSYIFFLWVLVFLLKKDNRFAHFHAKQGLVIFLGEIIFGFLSLIPFIGIIFYLAGLIGFFILSLRGIYAALTGKYTPLPVVGEIAGKLVI